MSLVVVSVLLGLTGCAGSDPTASPAKRPPGDSDRGADAPSADTVAPPAPTQPVTCRPPQPAPTEPEQTISVYFYCKHALNESAGGLEGDPVALPRRAQSRTPLRDALEHLLAGPTPAEEAAGFYFFSSDTAGMLENVVIRSDGTAVVDFAGQMKAVPNISASAAAGQMDRSLAFTIFQFPSVKAVTYRIGGDPDAWCDLFGIVCEEPLVTRSRFESLHG